MAERPSRCEWLQRILGETLSCRHRLCHAILDLPRKIVEQHRIVLRPGRLDEALHRGIRLAPVRGTVAQDRGRTIEIGRRSEEHPSELQSLMRISYAVFCSQKKKQHNN